MELALKTRLKELVGNDATIRERIFERELCSSDISAVPFAKRLFNTTPELVIQPLSIEALTQIVQFANEERIAVFPRGSASSGLGGIIPTVRGVVLDLSCLNKMLELDPEKGTLQVQTGVRWSEILEFLKLHNLSVRAYPSSFFSTVGGWINTGGYGIGSLRFGHLKDQVEAIEVLFPSGELKSIDSDEEEFVRFFGTEGQFGILVTATLKLRRKPTKSLPLLIYFEGPGDAFRFMTEMVQADIRPYHIMYLDAAHLETVNKRLGEDLFRVNDAALVEFEEEEERRNCIEFAEHRGILEEEYLAHYLWHERLFPMKQRSGRPTPLVCELLVPLKRAVLYLTQVKRLAKGYRAEIQVEAHLVAKDKALVMVTHHCDERKLFPYLLHMTLIPALMKLGIAGGGVPYGVGIWNTPFITDRFDERTLTIYQTYKKKVDPHHLLNPNKFFAVRTKWADIPGILFKPFIFRALIRSAVVLTPVLVRLMGLKEPGEAESCLEETVYSCMKCGSCAALCPAYMVTGDESLIPKNKLYLAKKLLAGEMIAKSDSDKAFLCMHCGLCREVCQNDLDLVTAWSALERMLEDKYGKPEEAIRNFVSAIEADEDYWRFAYAQKI
ncbi:MAG: FAD-binding protein [Methanophagales archaeon ANME-1-THS]|nr:MAG: FAD-binding protein [Methanophagales archaeon ANME-1-THS]